MIKLKISKGVLTMEVTYSPKGDYLIPDLILNEAPMIGKYGILRRRYLMTHKAGIYTGLLLTGKLEQHLQNIEEEANRLKDILISQMMMEQNVTEELKAIDQMMWLRKMNNIHQAAEEIVLTELIYN